MWSKQRWEGTCAPGLTLSRMSPPLLRACALSGPLEEGQVEQVSSQQLVKLQTCEANQDQQGSQGA